MLDRTVGECMHVTTAGIFLEELLAYQPAAEMQAKLARLAPQHVLDNTICKQHREF